MKAMLPITIVLVFVSMGCCCGRASEGGPTVADVFARTASHVYSIDFVGHEQPIASTFTEPELRILAKHPEALRSMVMDALARQDSVYGAKLAAHFKIVESLPLLKDKLFVPRPCYGWEGPDCSKRESYLFDEQYPYSIAYLNTIEKMTGEPISQCAALTKARMEIIERHLKNPESEFHYWALWIRSKFNDAVSEIDISNRGVRH